MKGIEPESQCTGGVLSQVLLQWLEIKHISCSLQVKWVYNFIFYFLPNENKVMNSERLLVQVNEENGITLSCYNGACS